VRESSQRALRFQCIELERSSSGMSDLAHETCEVEVKLMPFEDAVEHCDTIFPPGFRSVLDALVFAH
jgi:hypothetical protein